MFDIDLNDFHVVMVTGHRPGKLGGFAPGNPMERAVRKALRTALLNLQDLRKLQDPLGLPLCGLSGMALGVDQWFAEIVLDRGLPLVAAVPFEGQESTWPMASLRTYHALLRRARGVHMVTPGGYTAWKMRRRDRWMVANADQGIAVWDGSRGGTGHTVDYAREIGLPMEFIHPQTLPEEPE